LQKSISVSSAEISLLSGNLRLRRGPSSFSWESLELNLEDEDCPEEDRDTALGGGAPRKEIEGVPPNVELVAI
jgi:hypothetical protein